MALPSKATIRLRPPRRWKRMGIRMTSVFAVQPGLDAFHHAAILSPCCRSSPTRLARPSALIRTSNAFSCTSTRSTRSWTMRACSAGNSSPQTVAKSASRIVAPRLLVGLGHTDGDNQRYLARRARTARRRAATGACAAAGSTWRVTPIKALPTASSECVSRRASTQTSRVPAGYSDPTAVGSTLTSTDAVPGRHPTKFPRQARPLPPRGVRLCPMAPEVQPVPQHEPRERAWHNTRRRSEL